MTATPIRKDTFAVDQEVSPPADVASAVAEARKPAALPFGLQLPPARSVFDAAWPPVAGIVGFLVLWALLAPMVKTSLGALPGPGDVWQAFGGLMDENAAARIEAAAAEAAGGSYTGPPTFIDQIFTSLKTVALGFVLASIVAVPLGLVAGMSKRFNAAINPLLQVMRPVSPLAWLPIVTMVVSASITSDDPTLAKSFVISAVVVMLCSLWPTLINTAIGTASIDKDLINVGRVLKLGWFAQLTKLVLPSSLPYIFTGILLWSFLPGTIARVMPESWHWPERMAARIVGAPSRWDAGARLMQSDSPEAWNALVEAADIQRDNRDAIDACRKAAPTSQQLVRCTVKIRPNSQEGETAATPAGAATRSQNGA